MKKQLACPKQTESVGFIHPTEMIGILGEIVVLVEESASINSTVRGIPDNTLKLAQEILESIEETCDQEKINYLKKLVELKKCFPISEKIISQIEKFQNFNSSVSASRAYRYLKLLEASVILMSFLSAIIGLTYISLVNRNPLPFIRASAERYPRYRNFKEDFFKKSLANNPLQLISILIGQASYFLLSAAMEVPIERRPQHFLYRYHNFLYQYRHFSYLMSVFSLAILVFKNPETSFNPAAFSTLSHQFDQIVQDVDKLDSKPESYSKDLSIETYCTLSSISIAGTVSVLVLNLIKYNELLNILKKLIQKFISPPDPMLDVIKIVIDEKTKIETCVNNSAVTLLKKVSEQHLTREDKEKMASHLKTLAINKLIEMLEKEINPPRGIINFSQRGSTLNQKLRLLLEKVKKEQIQKEDEHETIERTFNNINSILKDAITLEIPLFPVLHLEPEEMLLGIRELSAIHISETQIPRRNPSFQETQETQENTVRLNSLIKQLFRGETGYVNNRAATSLADHPERKSYPVQFSKKLFPAFLFLNIIQKVIEKIEELATSELSLKRISMTSITSPLLPEYYSRTGEC